VVRQLHTAIIGRDIHPAEEAGYLDALTAQFLSDDRNVRNFVKFLTRRTLFRSGL
jgi:hypothetical protein